MKFRRPTISIECLALAVGALILISGAARAEDTAPTNDVIDRAIRVCTLGTKTDGNVNAGVSLLKKRLLSGEGGFSLSEIPSVLGNSVQGDDAKVAIFASMQKCVEAHVYNKSENIAPGRAAANTQVKQDGFSLTLQGCLNIQSDTISCPFILRNEGPDRTAYIQGSNSFIIDSNGIQQAAQMAQLGVEHGLQVGTFVASGVPIKGEISFGGLGQKISGVPRLIIGLGVREVNGGAPGFVLKWSDVPLGAP